MKLEICAASYRSAINAQAGGAARIELCTELAVGGLTPSYGCIKQVIAALRIPVFVLIRPRSGHFSYSKEEIDLMIEDIQICSSLGCAGIVSGVLNKDLTIDIENTKRLVAASGDLEFTFHRAFDWVADPYLALKELVELGVDRVLSSGQARSAEQGLEILSKLKNQAKDRLIVLPGGGIHANNAPLFQTAGFSEIHASATTVDQVAYVGKIPMNSVTHFGEHLEIHSDKERILEIQRAIVNGDRS